MFWLQYFLGTVFISHVEVKTDMWEIGTHTERGAQSKTIGLCFWLYVAASLNERLDYGSRLHAQCESNHRINTAGCNTHISYCSLAPTTSGPLVFSEFCSYRGVYSNNDSENYSLGKGENLSKDCVKCLEEPQMARESEKHPGLY